MISRSAKKISLDIDITVMNVTLKKVEEAKFLAVTLDNMLNWKMEINVIKMKISRLTVIYRLRESTESL